MDFRDLAPVRWLVGLAKNSPWLMIAAGLHLTLGAVLSVVYMQRTGPAEVPRDTSIGIARSADAPAELAELPPPIDRRKIPPRDQELELVPREVDPVFVPLEDPSVEPTDVTGDPTSLDDFGGDGAASGPIGVGSSDSRHGSGIPTPFSRRGGKPGAPRRGTPDRTGPSVQTEKAVFEGLAWLARHQDEDGGWSPATLARHCSETAPCIAAGTEVHPFYDAGLTGLALLAFLGAGIDQNSPHRITDPLTGAVHRLGPIVKSGVRWLIERQQEDGSFTPERAFLYNEALAAAALCEAYGLSRNRELKRAAQRAVDFLLAAQKVGSDGALGGWRYSSRAQLEQQRARGEIDEAAYADETLQVDISVTGWVVMALKSAELCGLDVPRESMEGALAYARSVSTDAGLVAYSTGEPGAKVRGAGDHFDYHTGTMSALGMLVRTFVARDLSDAFLESAAAHIAKDPPAASKDGLSVDYYYWYYATLALHQFDGPDSPRKGAGRYWEPWNRSLADALLPLQETSARSGACRRGAWLANDRWSRHGHALYNTAINVLTLEVYYRYENAFGAR